MLAYEKRLLFIMKRKNSKKKLIKGALCIVLLAILFVLVKKYHDIVIYDHLDVTLRSRVFEYGNNINLKSFVKKGNDDYHYSIVKDLNTSEVGKQQVEVKVEYKGVAKVVPIQLSVVDSIPPEIEIKEDTITIDEDNEINLLDNIGSVTDHGEAIEYKDEASVVDGDTNYYTVLKNGFDCRNPGEYSIGVVALDRAGNKTEKSFKVVVKEVVKVVVPLAPVYRNSVVTNAPANASGSDIVSIAYSYLGYNYVYGGSSPSVGFDCSGFVQYVYSQVGKSISRSSSTQAFDGVGVEYSEVQPGDILSWGHGGMVTHSAIYVGDGQMIHAMNSNTGVVISPVNGWTNADVLMAVRRVA